MKKYFGFSLMLVSGLLVSCAGEGCFGPQCRDVSDGDCQANSHPWQSISEIY